MEEIELLLKYYNLFVDIVKQVSLPAEKQISKLKGFAVADEIALDFGEIGMSYAKYLFNHGWLSEEQFLMAKYLDEKFDYMSDDKSLWSEDALITATEWKECRKYAKKMLEKL